ncbi:ATP-binding protein [Halorhabdus amylolytica]|uniref:ATP-binding protein n=1 Tax=Halorhabdus amylolytica TaxID=2559573 RepID=UPI0010AA2EDE|nr:ATP-binding protein [Halorhabdus amylolytica]
MIESEAQKEILEDKYEQYRGKADAYRAKGEADRAARFYRKAAETVDRIADVETSDTLTEKRHDLAENLRTASTQLEETGSLSDDSPVENENDESDDGSAARSTGSASEETDHPDAEQFLADPPEMNFGDVGGMSELKETLKDKVIDPLERPELYEQYDLGVVNAILLYGPPGTGKTYVTEALAGELGYNFVDVRATDITSSLVGEAADNVADLFTVARNHQPCLVFIDEIDALMPSRVGGSQKTQSQRQMVNQFLTELTETRGEDVIVVGATNLPDEVDDAAVSRFQERIEVPPPGASARAAILRVHFRSRPVLHEEIDWDHIKDLTSGYSARDLEIVATEAARIALEEARERDDLQPITQNHLAEAVNATEPSLSGGG